MKTEKRNVLRACILTMLLAMPVAGSYASSTLWADGARISGTYTVVGKNNGVTVDKSNEEVRAAGNVTIVNTVAAEAQGDKTMGIIAGVDQVNKSFVLDMGEHTLSAGEYGAFIDLTRGNNNKVTITNAENIVSNVNKSHVIYSSGTGQNISLTAIKNIEFNSKRSSGSSYPIYVTDKDSTISLSAGKDVVITNANPATIMEVWDGGTVTVHANHDAVFNQNYNTNRDVQFGYTYNPARILHAVRASLNISADNDILFNNKGKSRVVWGEDGKVNLSSKRDIIYNNQREDSNSAHLLDYGSEADIDAERDIIMKNVSVMEDVPSVKMLEVNRNSIANIKAKNDIYVKTKSGQVVSLIDTDASSAANITAGHDMTLDIGVAAPVVHAKSTVNLKAGNDMRLSTAGADSMALPIANLYADGRVANITAEATAGTLTISNQGAVGAYADNGGSITLGGKVVMNTADGAVVTEGGKITFNGPSLTLKSSTVGLTADDGNITLEGTADVDAVDGAIAQNGGTILFNGPLTIHSTATGLTADEGGITLDGAAVLTAADGAIAENGGTILFNGPLTLTSSAAGLTADGSNITVDGEAALDTADGAVAENEGTILFNGPLTIRSSGTALQAVDGGVIDASAADAEKYIEGHIVADSGSVSLELNKAGSYLTGMTTVSDSAALSRSAYRNRAADGTDEGTGTLDLNLGTGTVWNVTGDSSLTNLTNNGTVNMRDNSRTGQQLTVNNLSGEGTLAMDLDWLSNQGTKGATANSDYVTVTDSATGTQTVVADSSAMNLDKMTVNDRLYIASLHNSDAVLTSFIQGRIANKGHLYDPVIGLTHETTDDTTDWYFTAVDRAESNVVPAANVQNRALFDLATNMDTLNKRLGEARYADGENSGMWARWNYRHLGRDSYDGHGNRFELGYDAPVNGDDGSLLRQGLSFSYLKSQTSFDEGNGKYKGYTGSLYRTWFGQNGHYLDVVGRIGKINGEGTTSLFDGDESKNSFGTWYQQASVEWGRKKVLNDAWYIEPQSQLQYTHINGHDFRTNDGIGQDFDSVHSFIGRLGFRLGRDIDANKAWYFKADILHEFAGNRTYNLTSIDGLERLRFDKTNHDTWYDIGAGITAELSNDRSLWLEFERNFNGSYDNEWELNAGMTWRFH